MKTKEEIQARIEELAEEIIIAEKDNEPLRVAGLFREATGLQWVLDD